ncbi:MAG TPA: hypothetical protein VGM49_01055 [Candidatus Limnocylindrales bacterium]
MSIDPGVAYWLEMAEARATRDYLEGTREHDERGLGVQLEDIGGAVAFALTGLDNAFFNRVVGLGIDQPATRADVARAAKWFHGLSRTWSVMTVAETAKPSELADWAQAEGYFVSRSWPKLWRPLDGDLPIASTDIRLLPIGREHVEAFERITVQAFDFPEQVGPLASGAIGRDGWTHYLGFDGDTPVSTGATYVMGDVAWLGFGATLPTHRGRGAQSAMFARRLADARAAGCRLAITETGPDTPEEPNPSYRNMLRAGFELAYMRPNYVRRPAEAS